MIIGLDCEAQLDTELFCTFSGDVEAEKISGMLYATCPECGNTHEYQDDTDTNPAEM